MSDAGNLLVLVVRASLFISIGYGYVFQCTVVRRISGSLAQDLFRMVVTAGDKSALDFLASDKGSGEIEMTFRPDDAKTENQFPDVTGFIDQTRQAWRLEHIRAATP
jgi:hypothetical protein